MRVSAAALGAARLDAAARDDEEIKRRGVLLSKALMSFQAGLLDRGWSSADAMEATVSIVGAATTKLRREREA